MTCRLLAAVTLAVLAMFAGTRVEPAQAVTLEVVAGDYDRLSIPVFFELPSSLRGCTALKLVETDCGKPVPVQLLSGGQATAVWMIDDRLAAGTSRKYRLTAAAPCDTRPAVNIDDNGTALVLSVAGQPVLAYNYGVVACPDREQAWFDRSGFIHPITSPAGQVLTDAMPPDHYHQHGVMFAWVNTTFEGRHVDFWNSKERQGKVEHVKFAGTAQGPVFAEFAAELQHIDLTAPGGPKPALNEIWRVRVYNRQNGYLFDLESVQQCAGTSPLVINEYHYGGTAFRGARAWFDDKSGDFLTSEGKTLADGNHTRPCWVDAFGKQDGRVAGVTVFSSPDNFRSPQPVRLHPTKPYFCWAPMVLGQFRIEPAAPYVSRYRYFVHDEPIDPGRANSLWYSLADPPAVRIVDD